MRWSERVGRRIKLRDLHILQAAAEAGSMAKAATELAISQPAISYAIAEIERNLGVPLLDRTSQGVAPTAYSRALARPQRYRLQRATTGHQRDRRGCTRRSPASGWVFRR